MTDWLMVLVMLVWIVVSILAYGRAARALRLAIRCWQLNKRVTELTQRVGELEKGEGQ